MWTDGRTPIGDGSSRTHTIGRADSLSQQQQCRCCTAARVQQQWCCTVPELLTIVTGRRTIASLSVSVCLCHLKHSGEGEREKEKELENGNWN